MAESAPQAAARSAQSAGKGAASAVYGSLPQQVLNPPHACLPRARVPRPATDICMPLRPAFSVAQSALEVPFEGVMTYLMEINRQGALCKGRDARLLIAGP